jgi:hypothetical protein
VCRGREARELGRPVLAPEPVGRPQTNNDAGTSVLIVGVVEVSVLGMMGRMAVAAPVLVLAIGCAGGSQPATSGPAKHHVEVTSTGGPAPVTGQQPAQTRDKVISVRIKEGKVEGVPARVEVDRGTPVRLETTSDQRDELHVHGYDKTLQLTPGSPATLQFVADVPGVFEVETHDSGLLLFQLLVR